MGWLDHVIFISFDYENLKKVRAYLPKQPCQFLAWDSSDTLIHVLSEDKIDVDIFYNSLTKEKVDALHAAGIKINCWTVDEAEDAKRLISWGVDFITSDIIEGAEAYNL